MISGPYNYSSPKVQEGLERLLSELENTTYIDPLYTESWLRDFLDYVRRNQDYSPIDISNEKAFIEALNVVSLQKRKDKRLPFFRELDSSWYFFFFFQSYLGSGVTKYSEDVDFSSDGQHIIGARFMIQGAHIYDSNMEQIFVQELRDVCHRSPFNVTVFHYYFIFFDQFMMVFPTTIQCVR